MVHTFEIHFHLADGDIQRDVLTCPMAEVMDRAQSLFDAHEADEVEVRLGGQHMFSITARAA